MLLPDRSQPIGGQTRQSKNECDGNQRLGPDEIGQQVHRKRHQRHPQCQQSIAGLVQCRHVATAEIWQVAPRGKPAQQAHRQVDEKNPVPRKHLHQPSPQRRAEQRPDQPGNGNKAHSRQKTFPRIGAQYGQPAHRQQQRATSALHHAGRHQLCHIGRQAAEQGAQHKNQNGSHVNPACAKAVGHPARDWYQHGHGQRIHHQHGLHVQGVGLQAVGHRWQCRVDNGGIQCLHEKANCHQPQQDTQLTLMKGWFRWPKRTVRSVITHDGRRGVGGDGCRFHGKEGGP